MWIIGKEPCIGDIAVGVVRTVFASETRAAKVYTENEAYSKAINADTKLLKSIDDLESGRT